MSICKTTSRIEHIYTSTRSSVQVYLKSDMPITHAHRASNVLLKYEGKGVYTISIYFLSRDIFKANKGQHAKNYYFYNVAKLSLCPQYGYSNWPLGLK